MVDLIVAVASGFSTSHSPFQLVAFDQPNQLVSMFPQVLIPTYLVPVSVLLHLASMTKLRRTVRTWRFSRYSEVRGMWIKRRLRNWNG